MPITNDQLEKFIKENTEMMAEVRNQLKGLKRMYLFGRIWSITKILIIVVPLIWGYILIRPYVEDASEAYRELFSGNGQVKQLQQQAGQFQKLLELQDLLK